MGAQDKRPRRPLKWANYLVIPSGAKQVSAGRQLAGCHVARISAPGNMRAHLTAVFAPLAPSLSKIERQ